MNKFYILFLFLFVPIVLSAQKKNKVNYVFQEVQNIQVDGNLEEWQSALYHTDSDLWSFALSQSNGKIFAAAVIKDKALINEVIRQGVFVNLSYNDKKKEGARLFYPLMSMELLHKYVKDEYQTQDFTNAQMLSSVKGYYILGFSKVIDGLLSFDNEYDVKAVAKMDEKGHLLYESVVPLDLIKFESEEIAVQLGLNTKYSQVLRTAKKTPVLNSRGAVYGIRPSSIPSQKSPYSEETEVWFSGKVSK